MRKFGYIMLSIILFGACEQVIDLDNPGQSTDLLVVEGMITNELKRHEVRLSYTSPEPNQPRIPVSGAVMLITDGTNVVNLQEEPLGSGRYLTQLEVRGVANSTYFLYVRIGAMEYTAGARMLPVTPLKPVSARRVGQNRFRLQPNDEDSPSMVRNYIDWRHTDDCADDEYCNALQTYYTLNSIDVNQFFSPDEEIIDFPSRSIIIRKKYSLSPGHEAFIRALLSETLWRGGYFDVQQGNLPTNLSEGAVGYFAASSVISDTVLVRP